MVIKTEKTSPIYNKRWRYIPVTKQVIETYEVINGMSMPVNLDLFAEAI